ncbi:hypothetical protein SLEP1_g20994 [Rubroshorea leprosula]|uniref:Transposase (putative) gypsy type domain-containing protein n=1 Tax=Rubroshorea leprosula TaxID=152421 RepID=A0AAV5JAI0_9ROSI|nr:hypothetical protein SLEP1_g20994 [Rubroshorea leprosula]
MSSEETHSDGRVRGRVEEAESRDLGVPSNILEREDGRKLCFNPEEEVVSEVAGYETTLENRGSLAHLVKNYGVPGRVLVRPAGSRERGCSAPRDHWMPLYSHYLAAGLRFPFPDLLVWLLLEYGLGLTQLTPNVMRLVVAFAVYSRSRGVSFPTANVFKYFYVLNAGSGREKGWYYFTGRVANKRRRGLFSAGPSSIKGWKDKFFFADDTEWDKTDAEDVGELEKGGVGLLDVMEYTSQRMLDATEIYGPSSQRGEEMNKFLDAAGGAGIPKKGRGKRGEVKRWGEEISMPQAEVGNLAISQLGHIGGEVTVAEEGPIVAKRKRLKQQEAVEEIPEPEPVTAPLRLEGTSSASAVEFAAALPEQGYIRAPTTSFYDSGMRSTAKRFINAYFPEVDRQHAKDEVAARGSVGVVRQALEAINLVNALANEHHESLKERSQMKKENVELVKKSEAAEAEVARLKAEMEELRKENATFKKDSEISYQKRKICEAELQKREKELDDAGRAMAELELKKVKLEYPDVDVTKITFGEQEGEVEENGESSTADFCPEVTLKWEKDSRGQTILPPKFSFEFVVVGEEDEGSEVTEGAERPAEGADQPSQPAHNPEQPAASPSQTVD